MLEVLNCTKSNKKNSFSNISVVYKKKKKHFRNQCFINENNTQKRIQIVTTSNGPGFHSENNNVYRKPKTADNSRYRTIVLWLLL